MYFRESTRSPWSTVQNVTNLNSQNEWEPLTSYSEETDGISPVRRAKANKRVLALGNGESRKDIDLTSLYEYGIIYGCNALYRDFRPDALVVVDPVMKEEIWETDYLLENKAYFKDWGMDEPQGAGQRRRLLDKDDWGFRATPAYHYLKLGGNKAPDKKVINSNEVIRRKFPDDAHRIGYASGPLSILLACIEEQPDEVYLIGHDLFGFDDKFNNVYKDTPNYQGSLSPATPSDNWIIQLKQNFNDFGPASDHPIEFYHVNPLKKEISDWNLLVNIHSITLDEMWKRLNR